MAVGNGEQREADGRGFVAAQEQIPEGEEIPFGFGHLATVDEQKADMEPVAREGLAGGGFALRNLVLVMGKHQVFAAGVEVEAFAEILHGHGGALQMPAGTAAPDGSVPAGFSCRSCFPEGEVAGGVTLVFIDIDAGAVGHAFQIFFAELAVVREGAEAEVPVAILGAVGGVARGQLLDQMDHLGNVGGGAAEHLRPLHGEALEIVQKGLLEARGVVGDGDAGGSGVADDLVIDVGDVHDVADRNAEQVQRAAEKIDLEEGAEVADVSVVVNSGAAGVHAQHGSVGGKQFIQLSAEGVEEP